MTPFLQQIASFLVAVLMCVQSFAQETTSTDFFDTIKTYNLSTILTADSILTEDREGWKDTHKRAEIIGFIGDNYQRFFIHFVSVIQNPSNKYAYLVYGKTRVKETVCSFQGTITIKQASIYDSCEISTYKQGFVVCDVLFYEDNTHPSTGVIKGELKSKFLIDKQGHFRYDGLMFVADGYSNN